MRFSVVLLCSIIDLAIIFPRTSTLLPWSNNTNDSICTKLVTKITTHYVSYVDTYTHYVMLMFPRKKYRINYRKEYNEKYHFEHTCCTGYKNVSNTCTPMCTQKCINGICQAPDFCACSQGYEKISSNVCKPVCSNGCLHGDCVQPELCKCFPDYWLDSDGYTCRVACEENCESNHGYCLLPNTCVCHDGYKRLSNESNICEPFCQNECVNGKCIEPNVCSCNDGYELDANDSFNCKPKCDKNCTFGTCTAPNICSYDEGFQSSDEWNISKPICSQRCVTSICITPETCSCIDGYAASNTFEHICEPICEQACDNGTCVAPNTCKCNEGFVLHGDDVTVAVCKPYCTSPCGPDTECTAPDRCSCKEGYRDTDTNGTTNNVYKRTDYCRPICNKTCGPNGKCDAPNSCVCDEGYHNITTSDETSFVCQPFCESDCEYGRCTNPNVCTCDNGYERDDEGRCVSVCYSSCINGTCNEQNVCNCDEGFVLRNETICEPFCVNGCINGTCIAPNTCRCNEDFVEIQSNDTSTCIPACSRNCSGHGTCLNESDTCICYYGWTGWDCDEINVCVYKTTLNVSLLSSVTVIIEANSTLMESYDNAPLCYQCSDSLNNETLCLVVQSDESSTILTVGCFLSTKLPCYETPRHDAFKRSNHVTVSLIVIIAIVVIVGYAIVRKRSKQKTAPVTGVQSIQLNSGEMETLIVT